VKSWLYIIEAQNGLVKLGISGSPELRAETIHQCSPILTRLIAKWHGGREDECALHARFARLRRHREWFERIEELATFVEERRGLNVEVRPWGSLTTEDSIERRRASRVRQAAALRVRWADPGQREYWLRQIANGVEARRRGPPQ
jgi:hypothetical protein